MKITDVSTRLIDQYMFVQVDTDEGISGVGESGAWAFLTPAFYYTLFHNSYQKSAASKNKLSFRTLAGVES